MSTLTLTLPVVLAQAVWVRSPSRSPARGGHGASRRDRRRRRSSAQAPGDRESTAAGVGLHDDADGLAGGLVQELAAQRASPVPGTRPTITVIRRELLAQAAGRYDVGVLLCGVNDVLHRTLVSRWKVEVDAVVRELVERCGWVIVPGVPLHRLPVPAEDARHVSERARSGRGRSSRRRLSRAPARPVVGRLVPARTGDGVLLRHRRVPSLRRGLPPLGRDHRGGGARPPGGRCLHRPGG